MPDAPPLPRSSSTRRRPARTARERVAIRRRRRAPAAARWRSRELHGQLHDVHPRRGQQPAGGEIDRDHQRRRSAQPAHFGMPMTTFEDRRDRDQLAGEDGERADPQQRRHDRAHVAAVAQLEKIADRLADRAPPRRRRMRGPIQSASTDRSDRRRSDPPPRRQRRRDSRGRSRRSSIRAPMFAASIVEKIRPGPSPRPATKKSFVPRHPPADPQAEADQQRRIAEEQAEMKVIDERAIVADRAPRRMPADAGRLVAARTIASAIASAASAPIVVMSAVPFHVPVASANIVSPSAVRVDRLDRPREAVVGHLRDARHLRLSSAARWSRRRRSSCSRRRACGRACAPARSSLRASANVPSGVAHAGDDLARSPDRRRRRAR